MSGPLAGIRVLEFAQIAAGPFFGSLFADLGADVVKLERPDGGDGMGLAALMKGRGDLWRQFCVLVATSAGIVDLNRTTCAPDELVATVDVFV